MNIRLKTVRGVMKLCVKRRMIKRWWERGVKRERHTVIMFESHWENIEGRRGSVRKNSKAPVCEWPIPAH